MTIISSEAFRDWKKHAVTKKLWAELEKNRRGFFESWANGEVINDSVMNAKWIGAVQVMTLILDFNPVSEKNEVVNEN